MEPTNELKIEHESVLTVLEILEKISHDIISGKEVNVNDIDQLLEVQKVFVDNCHHGKEEKILFEAMEKVGIPKEGGPVGVMLLEHDNGREYIKEMREAISDYKAGNKEALRKFAVNSSYYASLMNDHIYKENNILYPMAEMHLSEDAKSELAKDFASIQSQETGGGKYEGYLSTIKKLKATYL